MTSENWCQLGHCRGNTGAAGGSEASQRAESPTNVLRPLLEKIGHAVTKPFGPMAGDERQGRLCIPAVCGSVVCVGLQRERTGQHDAADHRQQHQPSAPLASLAAATATLAHLKYVQSDAWPSPLEACINATIRNKEVMWTSQATWLWRFSQHSRHMLSGGPPS